MINQPTDTDKKDAVSIMLKEIEKIILRAIDEGKANPYTPLDLIAMAVQELLYISAELQTISDKFENDDNGGKAN